MFYNILQYSKSDSTTDQSTLEVLKKLDSYSSKLRVELDELLDVRLVRTFFNLLAIILLFRERRMGWLLSELGGYLCGHSHAPAGTKRISNLLRSKKWTASFLDKHFFDRTISRVKELKEAGKRPLLLWDDSRVEKHESWCAEGLCSVWSSKAKRLTQIRPGYYRPPKERICVPGFKWTGVFLSALGSSPSVCQMSWWTTKGKQKEDPDNIIWRLLDKCQQSMPKELLHVFDRGYASEKMLNYLFHFHQDFLIRWRKNVYLLYQEERLRIDKISRKTKARFSRTIYDKERKKTRRISVAWTKVAHPEHPDNQVTLLIIRNVKHHGGPMYLICSLDIQNAAMAWEMVSTYAHRWEAEQSFRFLKSELAIESPRLWFWDNRLKMMGILTVVYDFLLQFFRKNAKCIEILLRKYCHRTGKRYRNASIPLYRLRMAISIALNFLWVQSSG